MNILVHCQCRLCWTCCRIRNSSILAAHHIGREEWKGWNFFCWAYLAFWICNLGELGSCWGTLTAPPPLTPTNLDAEWRTSSLSTLLHDFCSHFGWTRSRRRIHTADSGRYSGKAARAGESSRFDNLRFQPHIRWDCQDWQALGSPFLCTLNFDTWTLPVRPSWRSCNTSRRRCAGCSPCLLYTSDAADE